MFFVGVFALSFFKPFCKEEWLTGFRSGIESKYYEKGEFANVDYCPSLLPKINKSEC